MKRFRTDIPKTSHFMLLEIMEALDIKSQGDALALCIQSVRDNIVDGSLHSLSSVTPTQEKLDRILSMLEEVLPEL